MQTNKILDTHFSYQPSLLPFTLFIYKYVYNIINVYVLYIKSRWIMDVKNVDIYLFRNELHLKRMFIISDSISYIIHNMFVFFVGWYLNVAKSSSCLLNVFFSFFVSLRGLYKMKLQILNTTLHAKSNNFIFINFSIFENTLLDLV